MSDDAPKNDKKEGVWCVVANVKREHSFGEWGKETRIGTPQFRGGAKVYIAGCYPGNCDSVVCIGLQRQGRKFVTCVVKVTRLENFRAKVVYHPEVVRRIREDERCWFDGREHAETYASEFPVWQALGRNGSSHDGRHERG